MTPDQALQEGGDPPLASACSWWVHCLAPGTPLASSGFLSSKVSLLLCCATAIHLVTVSYCLVCQLPLFVTLQLCVQYNAMPGRTSHKSIATVLASPERHSSLVLKQCCMHDSTIQLGSLHCETSNTLLRAALVGGGGQRGGGGGGVRPA